VGAPRLTNPGDDANYSGQNALIELKWSPPPEGLPSGAEHVVHIGVQVGPNRTDVDWRLTEAVGSQTSFFVPDWLFGQAPQEYGRGYLWYVEAARVTRNGDQVTTHPVSPPSEIRRFFWK
jgi:hypothetical protein